MPKSPETILVTGARAPVALHLARLFHGAGRRVILADTPARPVSSASVACAVYHRLPPPRFSRAAYAEALEDLIRAESVDLVVPTCEEVFYLAEAWHSRSMPVPLFAPNLDLLAGVHDKHAFIRMAESFGLAVPETKLLQSQDDLDLVRSRSRELVFKPVWSRFATHVLLRPEARALDRIRPTIAAPWVAQRFVEGDEISAHAVARDGAVKALALYRSLYRAGKGAGVCFERVDDPAARDLIEAFIAETRWTGQISFDLMREEGGRILPLECNPRATSGIHFFSDSPGFASAILEDGAEIAPNVRGVLGVWLALWVYGLPAALRARQVGRFLKTLDETHELFDWPGDPGPSRAQVPALIEIAGIALRERISLQAATTRDIEWNGPVQSSI